MEKFEEQTQTLVYGLVLAMLVLAVWLYHC